MKTISDTDYHELEKGIRRLMEITLSRSEHKKLADLLARIDGQPVSQTDNERIAHALSVFFRPGP